MDIQFSKTNTKCIILKCIMLSVIFIEYEISMFCKSSHLVCVDIFQSILTFFANGLVIEENAGAAVYLACPSP